MRIETLRRKYNIEVRYRNFPLHPNTPQSGLTLEELFAGRGIDLAAAQQRMTMLMQQEGLPYGERTMTFNSRLAQELAAWADTQDNGWAIHDALFRAYFVDGQNLAEIDTLTELAGRCGLSAQTAREVLEQRQFSETVDEDWQACRDWGVTGVPTFVAGDRALVGAQPLDALEQLLLSAGAQLRD